MPTTLQGDDLPVTPAEVETLWQKTRQVTAHADETIAVRSVSATEMQQLNQQYRGKDTPTNVLTFSYARDAADWPRPTDAAEDEAASHDVALCLSVAATEATTRGSNVRDYVALLLVHGFLHVIGLDHERNTAQEQTMRAHETTVLQACGFTALTL